MSDLLVEICHYEVEINGGHKLFSYEVISLSKPLRFMRILSLGYMLLVKLLGQILREPFSKPRMFSRYKGDVKELLNFFYTIS